MLNQELLHVVLNVGVAHDELTQSSGHVQGTETLWRSRLAGKACFSTLGSQEERETHDCKTLLINPRMVMKVVFVLLLANDNKKVVAAERGVSYASYSSDGHRISTETLRSPGVPLTDCDANIVNRIGLPQLLLH